MLVLEPTMVVRNFALRRLILHGTTGRTRNKKMRYHNGSGHYQGASGKVTDWARKLEHRPSTLNRHVHPMSKPSYAQSQWYGSTGQRVTAGSYHLVPKSCHVYCTADSHPKRITDDIFRFVIEKNCRPSQVRSGSHRARGRG